ncbi:6-pyruvoyl-tetrahydropterin synthase-related protein [Clostridium guangxiense]|uniref:6-pyruvoyl-tetrahydropterin synthase-related protein n=1 Tax=Clostridium guangxiense TaxID=1662055 RepID=UPI001E3E8268|nr:6-pyruvoyl-tetrahydropterin synthase-related protein [Clostridium guangxiense]MCD2346187.1 6-carboxytetrahydropterin synthase [Clostridium guangxiense]
MKFQGYLYKFNMNASHSVLINNKRGPSHSHTFLISLFVEMQGGEFVIYDEVEKVVNKFLSAYSGKEINEFEAFREVEPTLENIGDFLFEELSRILKENNINLLRLEISEIPTRVYVINGNGQVNIAGSSTKKIAKLMMNNIINLSSKELVKKFEDFDQSKEMLEKTEENRPQDVLEKKDAENEPEIESEIIQKRDKNKWKINNPIIKIAASILVLIFGAVILSIYLGKHWGYPWGLDTYGHIFKADILYQNIKKGNLYPLFTEYWYNGIQPFRYWAPFSYYVLAMFQFVSSGDPIKAYIIFIGAVFFIGGLGWLLWGIKSKRIFIALIIGIMWFFLPENLRVLFFEGNIPRVVITALIPYLFFFLWEFVEHEKKSAIIPMTIFMILIIMSHLMVGAMLGITTFIFLAIYSVVLKKFLKSSQIIIAMLLAFVICGIWIYPALKGGLVSMDSGATSEVMKSLSTPFTTSLNPFIRLGSSGRLGYFYYGLSIIIVSVLGIILSSKKSLPGFITVIIVFLGTTTAFIPVLIKLPLNQLLWMMRFTPIAYGIFMLSLLNWTKCKKRFMAIFLMIIIADSSLSFRFSLYPEGKNSNVETIMDEAKRITNQRIALLDSSLFESYPSFYIIGSGKKVSYSYGWAWQGASTAKNIVLLNTALENGYYNYMFDRSIELGCDTVIVRKNSLKKGKRSFNKINSAAELSKFKLDMETGDAYIFHRDTPKNFGVITNYSGLCIGRSAEQIPLQYPSFEIGKSQNIEDYTIDELRKYKVIYLSDFSYNDRKKAEEMLSKLSSMGVKIIIDMNKIPADAVTKSMTFMGITAQPISFDKKMPDLFFNGQKYISVNFDEKYKNWNTVYLQDLPKVEGIAWIKNKKLTFVGEGVGDNKNITYVGFNLMFHAMQDDDAGAISIMNSILGNSSSVLPERKIVPISVKYNNNSFSINSPKDNVNTTIAYLDSYNSTRKISDKQNLLNIEKGQANIKVTYPYLTDGIVVSLIGLTGFGILLVFIYKRRKIINGKGN